MSEIKIDRLEIRFQGVTRRKARPAVALLGQALLDRLAEDPARFPFTDNTRIDRIKAGSLQISAKTDATRLGQMMANRVLETVLSRQNK
jgi:hypothetical protein